MRSRLLSLVPRLFVLAVTLGTLSSRYVAAANPTAAPWGS